MTYRGEELITKEQAEILKGFAIIFVLMGHGYTNYIYRGPINIIAWGAAGTWIFLILSGYGLTESYLKNGITLKFLTRRIKTVYVPFVIMMLCEVLADKLILGKTLQLKYMIPAILGWVNYMEPCIDSTMWYITFFCLIISCLCVFSS